MLNKAAITKQWVRENYDINKERIEKKRTLRSEFDVDNLCPERASLSDFQEKVNSLIEELVEKHGELGQIDYQPDWSGPGEFVVTSIYYEKETDDEVINRIKRNVRSKIEQAKTKKEKEELERKQYERLKNKFEGETTNETS